MSFWKKTKDLSKSDKRKLIFEKYDGKCAYCASKLLLEQTTVDHIIPKAVFVSVLEQMKEDGNTPFYLSFLTANDLNHFDNLNPSCETCNKLKADLTLEQFKHKVKTSKWNYKTFRLKRRFKKGQEFLFYFEEVLISQK